MICNGSPMCLLQHQRNPPQTHDHKTVNKRPHFPEKTATTAMLLKKRPIIQPENTMEKTWRKPIENPRSNMPLLSKKPRKMMEKMHRKPKDQHALVIQKTQQNDGENHLKNLHNTCKCTKTTSRPNLQAPRLGAGALRPQADAARRHLAGLED